MRSLIVAITLLIVSATEAFAQAGGSITLDFGAPETMTFTAAQRSRFEKMRAHSQARGLPYPTIERMLRAFLADHLGQRDEEARGLEGADFCTRFKALTAAQQAAITTQTGGNAPPCP
jgi:hypothetical protein